MSRKLKTGNFYFILYAVLVFFSVIDASLINLGVITNAVYYVCILGLAVLTVLRGKYSVGRLAVIIAVLIVFGAAALTTHRLKLICYAFFIVSAEDIEFSKIVKTSLISLSVGLFVIFACCAVGLIPDYTYEHSGMIAHSYGFSYYGAVPYYIMYIFIMYLYLRAKKVTWLEIIGIFVLNYAVYKVFTVRLAMIIGIMFLAIYVLMVKLGVFRIDSFKFRTATIWLFPLMCLFTVACVMKYDGANSVWDDVNRVLSDRLVLSQEAMHSYRIPLFGQYIEMHGTASILRGGYTGEYFYIDSGYIYSILCNGILFTLLVMAMYTYLAHLTCYYRDKTFFVWLVAVAVFSIVNNTWTEIYYNPALLCFMTVFGRKRIKRRRRLNVTFR